jgi:2'-5' RNA ligase
LFFAALPDPRTAMALDAVREALGIELGLPDEGRPKDLLHVSLYGLGLFASLPSEVVRTARRIGEAVKVPAFEVALDRLETFSTRRGHRLVLTSSKGAAAWRPLWDAMGKSFLASGRRAIPFSRFKPHLTLIYDGKLIPRRILATPITLTVRDFVLVLSIHGETRHEHLGRWTLEG